MGAIIGERALQNKGKTPPGRRLVQAPTGALADRAVLAELMAFEAAIAIAGWLPGAV